MTTKAPPLVDYEDDSDYASAEDDDFMPDAEGDEPIAAASASEVSESEDDQAEALEANKKTPAKRKRAKKDDGEEAEDVGFENSGDEAIIGKGLKKAKRRKRRGEEEEEEGGEGGFVKTRRMAAMAEEEKVPLATTATSTVDVDALWASMLSAPTCIKRLSIAAPLATVDGVPAESAAPVSQTEAAAASALTTIPNPTEDDDTVTIHRTYQFAGKTHTETKVVPRDSAEARLYLASNPTASPNTTSASPPRRKAKLARRSMFEPVVIIVPRTDLKLGVGTIRERLTLVGKEDKGKKLNTVEKSKMDWAGYVDQEGLREDLEKAERDKGSYLQRKEFLERVEGKREDDARRARLGGKAKVA